MICGGCGRRDELERWDAFSAGWVVAHGLKLGTPIVAYDAWVCPGCMPPLVVTTAEQAQLGLGIEEIRSRQNRSR